MLVIAPGEHQQESESSPAVLRIGDGHAFGPPGVVARLRLRPWRLVGVLLFLVRTHRRLRLLGPFERIYAHWLIPCAWPLCLLPADRRPSALTVVLHGGDVRLLCRLPQFVRRAIVGSLLKRNAQFRFVSESLRKRLSQATVPNLYSASYVEACRVQVAGVPSREQSRCELGIKMNSTLCLLVARLVPSKRVSTALRTVQHIPNLTVIVVGSGPRLRELQNRFPAVQFVGQQSPATTLKYMAAADVLISASRIEGAPLAIREARALGIPVASVPAGDLLAQSKQDSDLWVLPDDKRLHFGSPAQ